MKRLNPTFPADALDEAFRKVTVPQHPSLIANNRAFHRMLMDGITVPAAQEHLLAKAAKEKKPEEHKQKFMQAVTDLSKAFALAVPHEKAIEIRDDVGFFQAVRAVLAKGDSERRKSDDEMNHAIRQIISRAVASDEVVDIFAAAGLKRPDISYGRR